MMFEREQLLLLRDALTEAIDFAESTFEAECPRGREQSPEEREVLDKLRRKIRTYRQLLISVQDELIAQNAAKRHAHA